MKRVFALFCVLTLAIASVGIVGCGGAPDNTATQTNTKGKSAPKNSDTENNSEGKSTDTAAGGQARAVSPPKE